MGNLASYTTITIGKCTLVRLVDRLWTTLIQNIIHCIWCSTFYIGSRWYMGVCSKGQYALVVRKSSLEDIYIDKYLICLDLMGHKIYFSMRV